MRNADWLIVMGGGAVPLATGSDRIVQFATGWLASGKFISSLAILFGFGAGLMAARSLRAGDSPRSVLARRYVWLMALGMAHMLLFPGDILFLYGLTGIVLLAFVTLRIASVFAWSATLFAIYTVLGLRYWGYVSRAAGEEAGAEAGLDTFMR